MDGRSADGSSIESDRSGYFPDQASGKFSEPKSQEKSETSIFTRNRWNANGGFATRRRIDINNVNNKAIISKAVKRLQINDRNNRNKKRKTKNATIRNNHIPADVDKK